MSRYEATEAIEEMQQNLRLLKLTLDAETERYIPIDKLSEFVTELMDGYVREFKKAFPVMWDRVRSIQGKLEETEKHIEAKYQEDQKLQYAWASNQINTYKANVDKLMAERKEQKHFVADWMNALERELRERLERLELQVNGPGEITDAV